MPFYEYECSNCQFYSEVLQKLSDPPLKKCPSCGKNTFKKLVSAPVFRLKGSGWYETDFKSDQDHKRNLAGSEKEEGGAPKTDAAPAAAEGKADAKADAKVAAAGESKAPKSDVKSDAKGEAASPVRSARSTSRSVRPGLKATPARAGASKPAPRAAPKPTARAVKRSGAKGKVAKRRGSR
jgi:putative FmdB family regulatory protein